MQIHLLAPIVVAASVLFVHALDFDISIQHPDISVHLRDDTKALLPEVNTRIDCAIELLKKTTEGDAASKTKVAMAFGEAAEAADWRIIKHHFEQLKTIHVPIWKDNDPAHGKIGFGMSVPSTMLTDEWKLPHYAGKTIPPAVVIYTSGLHEPTTPLEQKLRTVIHEAVHLLDMDIMTDHYLADQDGKMTPATYDDINKATPDQSVVEVYYHANDHYDFFLNDMQSGYHALLLGAPDAYALLTYICKHGRVPTNRELWDV